MNYFKPLRRKLGVVALAIACVFTAGWVRSRTTTDLLFIHGVFIAISEKGGLSLSQKVRFKTEMSNGAIAEATFHSTAWLSRIKHCALDPASTRIIQMDHVAIPFWPAAIPLTLFSAWLLVSKPKQKSGPPQI